MRSCVAIVDPGFLGGEVFRSCREVGRGGSEEVPEGGSGDDPG